MIASIIAMEIDHVRRTIRGFGRCRTLSGRTLCRVPGAISQKGAGQRLFAANASAYGMGVAGRRGDSPRGGSKYNGQTVEKRTFPASQVKMARSSTITTLHQTQVSLFARYFGTSRDALTPEHIRTYQIYPTNRRSGPPARYIWLLRRFGSFTGLRSKKSGPLEKISRFPRRHRSYPSY
jgi:hypothetical protein